MVGVLAVIYLGLNADTEISIMLLFSEIRPRCDTIWRRVAAGKINKKQAVSELRKWMVEQQKEDIRNCIEIFKLGWLE